MSSFDIETYISEVFQRELQEDRRHERALSRRCLYALAIVVGMVAARAIWFV